MEDFITINTNQNNQMAEWQQGNAINTYWTYSFVSRAAFYAMVGARYFDFMNRWVKNWLYWYDGWVPYFHSETSGIISTRLATALVDRTARKVAGGRLMFKNAGKESQDQEEVNKGLLFVNRWAKDTNFEQVVKKATKYCAAAGTAIIKLNKDERGFWAEALRFDSFLPTVDFRGRLVDVKCFLQQYTNLSEQSGQNHVDSYYIVEHRYFGNYKTVKGITIKNTPLVQYEVHRASGTITTGNYISQSGERMNWEDLPKTIRERIQKDYSYGQLDYDCPILLPFVDSLGAELLTWTEGVSNVPELPFGDSLLANLIGTLESYDYYFSAFNTDMYTGRARVLVPKGMTKANNQQSNFNNGLDSYLYTKVDMVDPEKQTPTPIQFDLRATDWATIRDTLIQNISINTGLNISTIASFLNDTTGNKTAREISTEENETLGFVNYKRALIEKPINRLIEQLLRLNGITDDVVLRWSNAELTNRSMLADILSTARAGGFISKKKAVEMFNFDDDYEQIQAEYDLINKDEQDSVFGGAEPPIGEENYDTEIDSGSGSSNGSGEQDTADSAQRLPNENTEEDNTSANPKGNTGLRKIFEKFRFGKRDNTKS